MNATIAMLDAMPTVAILTLGCKLNQAESEALARELLANGCRIIDRLAPARTAPHEPPPDAVVINTCSVTHVADRKSRHLARLARRLAPKATIVLAGCYVDSAGPDLAQRLGADWLFATAEKPAIAGRLLGQWRRHGRPHALRPTHILRTRAFVKVQEGCDEVCSFCIVPRTRGRERSVPIADVVAEVRARQQEGAQEVVLTGTQLGNYGRDLGLPHGPKDLLAALLTDEAVSRSPTRLRLSSLQAQDITPDLLALWRHPRLCRHFHLPLQSGSDRVLTVMRRRYGPDQFRRAVALLRHSVPDVAITTDVIVGFPGETDDDFERTVRLCQEIDFAAIHVFPYSRRPRTAAALLEEQVPQRVKRHRLDRMLALAHASADAFRARFCGRTMEVLWEEARLDPHRRLLWRGLTDNYVRVYTAARSDPPPDGQGRAPSLGIEDGSALPRRDETDLRNRLLPARLGEPVGDGLWGELEPEADLSPRRGASRGEPCRTCPSAGGED
jgi:threonylcarbamoyladenosine tRNA methylthiotransferase MtaB